MDNILISDDLQYFNTFEKCLEYIRTNFDSIELTVFTEQPTQQDILNVRQNYIDPYEKGGIKPKLDNNCLMVFDTENWNSCYLLESIVRCLHNDEFRSKIDELVIFQNPYYKINLSDVTLEGTKFISNEEEIIEAFGISEGMLHENLEDIENGELTSARIDVLKDSQIIDFIERHLINPRLVYNSVSDMEVRTVAEYCIPIVSQEIKTLVCGVEQNEA